MSQPPSPKKIQVTLLKSRSASGTEDISKMTTHLEGVLSEREGVDLKVRQTLTDATLKSSDFIVFCGYDLSSLSEIFKALAFVESIDTPLPIPKLFLYEEPGQSIREDLDNLILRGIDLRRVGARPYGALIDSWTYRDIVGTVDSEARRRGIGRNFEGVTTSEQRDSGDSGQASGA